MLPLHTIMNFPDVVPEVPDSPFSAVWLDKPSCTAHLYACIVSGEWVPTAPKDTPLPKGVVRSLVLPHDGPFDNVVGVSKGGWFVLCSPLKVVQYSLLPTPGTMNVVYIWEFPMHLAATFKHKGISASYHKALNKMATWTRCTYTDAAAGTKDKTFFDIGRVTHRLDAEGTCLALSRDVTPSQTTVVDIIGGGSAVLWASDVELVSNDEKKTEGKTTAVSPFYVGTPMFVRRGTEGAAAGTGSEEERRDGCVFIRKMGGFAGRLT